ncbi:hypothetical protein GTNG_2226 [Geobacillus thermodenitrificans NG80-2]|jgi:hypothetical protein|uniref:Uncharacterized protein n=1 Tax=Geobacillus thermodenitrificans (strain NG80-2) TaxID=420246 RepID=A4IQH1_GEOTN|nr:hypothetical protein GTNG_2226 [Geobacillus thermodenitrificans NG80-2]
MGQDAHNDKQEHLFAKQGYSCRAKPKTVAIPRRTTDAARADTARLKTVMRTSSSFSHPDYTVGSGIAPDRAYTARGLRGFGLITAGREFHPAPKDVQLYHDIPLYHIDGFTSSLGDPKPIHGSPYETSRQQDEKQKPIRSACPFSIFRPLLTVRQPLSLPSSHHRFSSL